MAIKIGLEQSEQSRWLAVALEGGRRPRPGATLQPPTTRPGG
jgi:hypothetical protein